MKKATVNAFLVGSISFSFIEALRVKSGLMVDIAVSLEHPTELMTPHHRFAITVTAA